jgi:hypothetical protein
MARTLDRRRAVYRILKAVLPSAYGDEKFAEIIGGHWSPGAGTTCAYLTALVLVMIGARDGRYVNRDDPESKGRCVFEFGDKANGISKLYYGGQKAGVWVDDGPGREPQYGDLVYMTDGTNDGAHVEVVLTIDGSTWTAGAAGQGTREHQEAKIITRTITDEREKGGKRWVSSQAAGGRKYVVGWVDLDAVELAEPPMGVAAEEEPEAPPFWQRAVGAGIGAIIIGGLLWLLGRRTTPPPLPPV